MSALSRQGMHIRNSPIIPQNPLGFHPKSTFYECYICKMVYTKQSNIFQLTYLASGAWVRTIRKLASSARWYRPLLLLVWDSPKPLGFLKMVFWRKLRLWLNAGKEQAYCRDNVGFLKLVCIPISDKMYIGRFPLSGICFFVRQFFQFPIRMWHRWGCN